MSYVYGDETLVECDECHRVLGLKDVFAYHFVIGYQNEAVDVDLHLCPGCVHTLRTDIAAFEQRQRNLAATEQLEETTNE